MHLYKAYAIVCIFFHTFPHKKVSIIVANFGRTSDCVWPPPFMCQLMAKIGPAVTDNLHTDLHIKLYLNYRRCDLPKPFLFEVDTIC